MSAVRKRNMRTSSSGGQHNVRILTLPARYVIAFTLYIAWKKMFSVYEKVFKSLYFSRLFEMKYFSHNRKWKCKNLKENLHPLLVSNLFIDKIWNKINKPTEDKYLIFGEQLLLERNKFTDMGLFILG